MDSLELVQIAVLAFFGGIGSSAGAELTKYLIARAKRHEVVKRIVEP